MVHQEVWAGRLWAARPLIVVEDIVERSLLWIPCGTRRKVPATPPHRDDPLDIHSRTIQNLLHEDWLMGDDVWDVSSLWILRPGEWHSTWISWLPDGSHLGWYINLQQSLRRTPIGFEAMDLMLDVVVEPDLSWRWKDREEFDEIVQRGLFDDTLAERVMAEAPRHRRHRTRTVTVRRTVAVVAPRPWLGPTSAARRVGRRPSVTRDPAIQGTRRRDDRMPFSDIADDGVRSVRLGARAMDRASLPRCRRDGSATPHIDVGTQAIQCSSTTSRPSAADLLTNVCGDRPRTASATIAVQPRSVEKIQLPHCDDVVGQTVEQRPLVGIERTLERSSPRT